MNRELITKSASYLKEKFQETTTSRTNPWIWTWCISR